MYVHMYSCSRVFCVGCVCIFTCICTHNMCPCSPQVVVSVGRSLSYTLGSITFVTSAVSQFPVAAVAGGFVGGGVSLIFLIVAIILVVHRRESVMRSQVNVLMMQMKTQAGERKRSKCCTLYVCMCGYVCICVCISCAYCVRMLASM